MIKSNRGHENIPQNKGKESSQFSGSTYSFKRQHPGEISGILNKESCLGNRSRGSRRGASNHWGGQNYRKTEKLTADLQPREETVKTRVVTKMGIIEQGMQKMELETLPEDRDEGLFFFKKKK